VRIEGHLAYAMLFLPEAHPRLFDSEESLEVGFFTPAEIEAMPMHESIRLRIRHYLEHADRASAWARREAWPGSRCGR
jgi:hypothetical protein